MRAIATSMVLAVLVAATTAGRAGAEPSAILTVRLYNTAGIPASHLLAARRTAESILRDTGMEVSFRMCGRLARTEEPIDPCDQSLKPTEVVLRVIDAPSFSATLDSEAYGLTYIVKETDRGWLATVFANRIDRAARRAGVESGTVLGRVMAHEVGHLLLGSGYHSAAGVMRAEWPDALLNHNDDEWRFSLLEAASMQRALVTITRQLPRNAAALDRLPTDSIPRSSAF